MLIRIYTDSILGDFATDQFDHRASIILDFIFNLNQIAILESFIFHTHTGFAAEPGSVLRQIDSQA